MNSLTRNEKLILALFLCVIFLYSFNAIHDSDSFYHLKTGAVIWETKSIPHVDIFSSTAFGRPWVTHEWLAEVLFYLVSRAGLWALVASVGFLAAAAYYFAFQAARTRRQICPILVAPMLFLLSYSNAVRWIPRPQVWSFFFLAFLLFCLERYRAHHHTKYFWFSAGIILIWANMHASVVLGLAVIMWYAVAEWLGKRFPVLEANVLSHITGRLPLAYLAIATPFIALLNPNTYHVLTYSFSVQTGAQNFNVLEWQSIVRFLHNPNIAFIAIEILIGLAIAIYWYGIRKESRDVTMLGLLSGISVLPVLAVRHVTLWPIAAAFVLAEPLSKMTAPFFARISPRHAIIGVVALGFFFIALRIHYFPMKPIDASLLPVHATDFIVENQLKGPLFNLYNEGGYLIWRFWPEEHVFIDGRSEVYPGTPTRDFFDIIGSGPKWDELTNKKYNINYFILDYAQSTLYRSINKLVARLIHDQWPLVYWDDRYIIFVRPSEINGNIISRYGLRHVNPFRSAESIPAAEAPAAEAELDGLLKYFASHDIISNAVLDYAWRFERVQMGK